MLIRIIIRSQYSAIEASIPNSVQCGFLPPRLVRPTRKSLPNELFAKFAQLTGKNPSSVPATAQSLYEQTLVVRSQIGDDAAFHDLLKLYSPRLHAFVSKMLCRNSGDGAEDLLQEIWVSIFRSLPGLLDVTKFRAWAFRIARDRIYAEYRRRKLPFKSLDEVDPQVLLEPEPNSSSIDAEDLRRCLDALSPGHREVLLLRFFEDMNYEDIARVTSCSLGTVRSRIHYAKQALRRAVEGTLYEC